MKFFLLLFSILLINVESLYFHLFQNTKKCFYDDFYKQLVVLIRYEVLNKNFSFMTQNDRRIEITIISESENKVILSHQSGKLKGKVSHTIEKGGKYKICITSPDHEMYEKNKKIKVALIIDTDQDEIEDHSNIVKNKDFEVVNENVRKIAYKADEITRMQDYQIEYEDQFSKTQFESSNRIVMMTIIQIGIISLIGLWQIYSLRKVFKEKAWSPF